MKIDKTIIKPMVVLCSIGLILLIVIAIIDYIGVKIIGYNGLVFQIHCYSYGLTFWLASVIFSYALYKLQLIKKNFNIIFIGVILGGIWWLLTFWFLMAGFHGAIGGWY